MQVWRGGVKELARRPAWADRKPDLVAEKNVPWPSLDRLGSRQGTQVDRPLAQPGPAGRPVGFLHFTATFLPSPFSNRQPVILLFLHIVGSTGILFI